MPGTASKKYNYGLQPMIDDAGSVLIHADNASGTDYLARFTVALDKIGVEDALDLLQVAFFQLLESLSEKQQQAYFATLTGDDDED